MDTHCYEPVKTTEDEKEETSCTPFLRQLFVSTGALTIVLSVGICYGAPTIFIHQIRKEANSTEAVSLEMASWLSSIFGYSSLPWLFILTAVSHVYGRRKAFILVSFSTIAMFICFYCSVTVTHLLISSILQGMTHASSFPVIITILSEFLTPEYRGIFLTMKTASIFWGVWFSNAIGAFSHWSNIPLFGLVCSIFSLTAFYWPESPYWLASKGRFDECRKSHRWLKGTSAKAEMELEKMLNGQIQICKFGSIKQITKRQFYKPTLISCLMMLLFYASGKLVCSIYAIDILKKMTGSESAAVVGMLILDGATVLSMYIGCFLNGVLKRRVQLFTSSIIGIVFLFTLALYLYLINVGVIVENNVLTIVLLAVFSIAMSSGPGVMAPSTFGELIPFKYKNMCLIFVSVWFEVLHSSVLKIFPYIYMACGLDGTFLMYGIVMVIVTVILYKCLPEAKGKTLQEIEEYFK